MISSSDTKYILNVSFPKSKYVGKQDISYAGNILKQAESTWSNSSVPTLSILKVANWFLYHSSMSDKKLQKLCYYAYSWYIVFFNDPEVVVDDEFHVLFTDRFEAWVHGPVCRVLYNKYRGYGWKDIPKVEIQPKFDEDINDLLNQVLSAYGQFNADQLERLTHSEDPWIKARKGLAPGEPCSNTISPKDIFEFYSAKLLNE